MQAEDDDDASANQRDALRVQALVLSLGFQFCWKKSLVGLPVAGAAESMTKWSIVRGMLEQLPKNGPGSETSAAPSASVSEYSVADRLLAAAAASAQANYPQAVPAPQGNLFDEKMFKEQEKVWSAFMDHNPCSKPVRMHPACRALTDAMWTSIDQIASKGTIVPGKSEISVSEVIHTLAGELSKTFLWQWDVLLKSAAKHLSAKSCLPEVCKELFPTTNDLEAFMLLRTKYTVYVLTELCGPEAPLGNVPDFAKLAVGIQSMAFDGKNCNLVYLRLEQSITGGSTESWSSVWLQVLTSVTSAPSRDTSLTTAMERVLSKLNPTLSSASSQKPASPEVAAGQTSAADADVDADDDHLLAPIPITRLNGFALPESDPDCVMPEHEHNNAPTTTLPHGSFSLHAVKRLFE
jgi:hypothetical protein